MAYEERNISIYGDEEAFFDALEAFLTTNTVVSNLVAFASGNVAAAGTVTTRTLNLLLIRKGGDVILNIGSRTEIIGQGTIALAVIPNENNYYVYGTTGSRTNWTFIKSDTQEIYTLSPYHTYPKATGQLFLDPELPILNSANGEFLFSTTGFVGLGGAEGQHFYTGVNGDRYYAIKPNVAIKMNA